MAVFTFVFPYRNGMYVKQVEADDVTAASAKWAELAQKDSYGKQKLEGPLQEELDETPPVPLNGLVNSWSTCLFTGKAFTILTIVRTET